MGCGDRGKTGVRTERPIFKKKPEAQEASVERVLWCQSWEEAGGEFLAPQTTARRESWEPKSHMRTAHVRSCKLQQVEQDGRAAPSPEEGSHQCAVLCFIPLNLNLNPTHGRSLEEFSLSRTTE